MKAIILAAGIGNRLGKHSNNKPKALLEFDGESLLKRQIETLKAKLTKGLLQLKVGYWILGYYRMLQFVVFHLTGY